MSTNVFSRLRRILAPPPLQLVQVVAVNGDGTSLVTYPMGTPITPLAPGLAAGNQVTVRGSSVAPGGYAWVRNGVIESEAPSSALTETVVGVVVAQPFGPAAIARPTAVPAQTAPRTGPYTLNLASFLTGGWLPFTFTVTAGALPPGLSLNATSGQVTGTPTTAGSYSATFSVEDSTHVILNMGAVAFTIT